MSVPEQYMMKEGFFSAGTRFDQIVSVYGRGTIWATFEGLESGAEYSVFYFVSVDNSALNSRSSGVEYSNLRARNVLVVDLGAVHLHACVGLAVLALMGLF